MREGRSAIVTACGRIGYNRQRINLSTVFADQKVGIKQAIKVQSSTMRLWRLRRSSLK